MLDITSYRRKKKYVQPLTIMREFYYDYSKSSRYPPQPSTNVQTPDPLYKCTLSVQKFNNSISGLQAFTDRYINPNINKQEVKKKELKLLNLDKLRYGALKKQSCVFKQDYSHSIPFLRAHSSIKCSTEPIQTIQLQQLSCRRQKKPQTQNLLYKDRKPTIKNPTKQFKQMCLEKENVQKIQTTKKEKTRQMRQNWIVNNLYLKYEGEHNPRNIKIRCRQRDRFQTTKQNIFSSS